MLAAERGHAGNVKLLLDRGANPAVRDHEGWTAYVLALTAGRDDVLRVLSRHEPLVAGLHTDLMVAVTVRNCREASGRAAVDPVARGWEFTAVFNVRPGVSCVQQRFVDNLSLAIDVRVVRAKDDAALLEKTFGGGFKGLRARQQPRTVPCDIRRVGEIQRSANLLGCRRGMPARAVPSATIRLSS